MNQVYDEYMKLFPHSIFVVAINFDDENLMAKSIEAGEPLADDIFNFPDGANY